MLISLSLSISKFFENSRKLELWISLTPTFFFSENQFGFIQGRSINYENFFVDKLIHENLDFSYKVMGIYLDVNKAFNSITHELLLKN